ncbi:tRNA (guanosine(37)-N1)-methyltransferase TrmD [bacterium]|jgi:tRNA (guanine37-N1)-methyltransferase|nr:tRNA (guanosine(37)-N1)-methyltransferase TrmD [bacterium]NBX49958.1 tRNA (guanosine(37)-N1)-methyltransferase TrmD [bacterium]
MLHIDILTIFPEVVTPYAHAAMLGRAQKNKLIQIRAHQLRDYSADKKHHKVDDTPYGGGPGMIMTVQPFDAALRKIRLRKKLFSRVVPKTHVVLTAAYGKPFTQADAARLALYDQVLFLCGRYEGIDHRVEEAFVDEVFSIGPYVLTGGELPALVMTDAIARNIPGVLGNQETLAEESHASSGWLEYPQYTKPERYIVEPFPGEKKRTSEELRVPAELLSGNHKKIATWRSAQAFKRSSREE